MSILKIIFLTIHFIIFYVSPSYAYLDPGTGSIILQALVGLFAAGVATASIYWLKLKTFLSKIFKKQNQNKKN